MVEAKTYSVEIRGWYRLFRGIIGFLLRVLCRLEIQGLEHVPDEGPYLLVSNHLHWLDPPVLGVAFPYRGQVFAAEKWEHHWLLGPLLKSMGAIFVNRGEVDRRALRRALGLYLMEQLMDSVRFRFDPEKGNTLIMKKRLHGGE